MLLLISSNPLVRPQANPANGARPVRKVPLTRTLKIAVVAVDGGGNTAAAAHPAPAALGVWPGAPDEPPEGPAGFDVFEDGSVLIADPLLKRLALYDAQGTFKRAWNVGFAADSVRITGSGLVLVREETTGTLRVFDREGNARPDETAAPPSLPHAEVPPGGKSGTLSAAAGSGPGRPLSVRYDEPGSALLSLEGLDVDPDRGTFVAIETSVPDGGAEAINVRKFIRRYSLQGALVCESTALPLDYYVLPVDEIRVHKGVAYQLLTTRNEVRINEWDTNEK